MNANPKFVLWLDRDGTIVDDPGYLDDPAALRLLPGAARALARLNDAGALVVLITNQSGIGRGYMSRETVDQIHARLSRELAQEGARLDHIELCPHTPDQNPVCDCRKPLPGMVLRARLELKLEASPRPEYLIGDKPADMLLAESLGIPSILVRTGDGRAAEAELASQAHPPTHVAEDLSGAADWILSRPELRNGG